MNKKSPLDQISIVHLNEESKMNLHGASEDTAM